jgi:hypothetical protein
VVGRKIGLERVELLTKYYQGGQIKDNKVGGGFGMYGEERCMQCFGGET